MKHENKLEQKLNQLGRNISMGQPIVNRVMLRIADVQTTRIQYVQRIRNLVMNHPKIKWLGPVAAVITIIIIMSVFNPGKGRGIAWAEVLETANTINKVHFVCITEREDGSKDTAQYWMDLVASKYLISCKSSGSEAYQRYDGVEKILEVYDPKTGTIRQESVGEELAKIIYPQNDVFLGWLMKLFAHANLAESKDWKKGPSATPDHTKFILDTITPDKYKMNASIEVDKATRRPVVMIIQGFMGGKKTKAQIVFDYPATVPTTFEEIGIEVKVKAAVNFDALKIDAHHIQGRLVNSRNQPVKGKVYFTFFTNQIVTAEDGTFQVPINEYFADSNTRLGIAYDLDRKLGRSFLLSAPDANKILTIVLEPVANITGHLVGKGGKGVSDVDLMVIINGLGLGQPPWEEKYYSDGKFEIRKVPIGVPMRLSLNKPGCFKSIDLQDIKSGEVLDLGKILLKPSSGYEGIKWDRTISGQITDENNLPVYGARLHCSFPGKMLETQANNKGFYRIENLPTDKQITLWVYYKGYGHNSFKIGPKIEGKFDLQIFPQGYKLYNKPAPGLQVERWYNPEPLTLEQQRGKVILLHIGIHIENYHQYIKKVQEMLTKYQDRGLVLIAIHKEKKAGWPAPVTTEDISVYLKKHNINFPVALDRAGGVTYTEYGVKADPAMYLVDKKGVLRCSPTENNLEQWIIQLLDEK